MTAAVLSLRGGHFADASRLEPVKWLAVVAMVCDHLAITLLPSQAWLRDIGTFAFPAFALSFGVGLAASTDPFRVASRLVAPAVVAQVCWLAIDGAWHPLNVLFMFSLCALVVAVIELRSVRRGVGMAGLLVVGGVFVALLPSAKFEGGVMGFLLVAGAYAGARWGWWWASPAPLLWLAFLPSPGFALGAFAVFFAPRLAWSLPRRSGVLSWVYAGHLFLIATGLLFAVKPQ